MTARRERRATGTRTATDLLTHPAQLLRVLRGQPAKDPADDLRILRGGGHPLIVSAIRYEQGRWRRGTLLLDLQAAEPITWRRWPRRKGSEPLSAPIDVEGVRPVSGPDGERIKAGLFRILTIHTGGQSWRLAVPAVDVELLRVAIAYTNRAVA